MENTFDITKENILDVIKDDHNPDEGIYKVTQYLFDQVHNRIPKKFQNVPAEVIIDAFIGAYLTTKGLQWTSKNIVDKILPGFHDKALPKLERACEFGIPLYFSLYALFKPKKFTCWMYAKPLDNLGIVTAYLAGVLAAEQDFHRRKK